jgi:hypothetical protein
MEEKDLDNQRGDGMITYRRSRFHRLICEDERKKLSDLFENVAKTKYFRMTVTNKYCTCKEIPQRGGNF